MTLTDLDRKSAALEALRAAWEARLLVTVGAKVADAHAHAYKALTDALKARADGRSSLAQIGRSPSYKAAVSRLGELRDWLAGKSQSALDGKVRDARAAFLTLASELWFPLIGADLRSRSTAAPTKDQLRQVRAAAVHGYDPRKQLEAPFLSAANALKAALERAGRASTPGDAEDAILEAWRARTAGSLGQAVKTLLNDSVEYADREAGRALIHPDRLGKPGDEIPDGA